MISLSKQKALMDEALKQRLSNVGSILKSCGIDAWIVMCREYNEDPIFHALTPAHYPTARRITILVLTQQKHYTVSMPDSQLHQFYEQAYDVHKETQMAALEKLLRKLNPNKIAINTSDHFAFTDGLSSGLYRMMMEQLPKDLTDKMVSSDEVGIQLLSVRTPLEMQLYPKVMEIAMNIIDSVFSKEKIHPGITTCLDLMDDMEQQVNDLGLSTWFESTIDLQRHDGMHEGNTVIEKGDLLHCDFGIRCLNLCTDTQRLCYVLKDGETALPDELSAAMKRNNRFQDIVCENLKIGASGNEVFTRSIEAAVKEGLRPMLYTHPLGFYGHGAGPTIGLFSNQHPLPVQGDLKVMNHTGYALELNTTEYLSCYQRDTFIFTEESIVLNDDEITFLAPNRDQIKII